MSAAESSTERTQASVGLRPAAPPAVIRDPGLLPRQRCIALLTIVVPSLGTTAALALGCVQGVARHDLLLCVVGIVLAQLCLEVGYHRLLAHRAFRTGTWTRAALAVGGAWAGQGRVLHWVANHRRHHLHSDRPEDPHSPHVRRRADGRIEPLRGWRGLLHAHWGHMLSDGVPNATLFARDLAQDRMLRRVNELYGLWVLVGLALPTLVGWWCGGSLSAAAGGFLWGGLVRTFVVQNVTWGVASVTHYFGRVRFATGDESRNLAWTALPSFGAGYQNNHHAFPHAARLGFAPWELDVGAWFIRGLVACGLAWDVQQPSAAELAAKRLPGAGAPRREA